MRCTSFEEQPNRIDEILKMNQKMQNDFVFPFEKLDIWQLAINLADFVFNLLESFPPNKYLRIIGQMESAVSSVAQNIAEGKGRQSKKEFIQFLYISEGSLFEVLTLAEIMRRRKLIEEKDMINIRQQAELIDRKLHGLITLQRHLPVTPNFIFCHAGLDPASRSPPMTMESKEPSFRSL